jgi:hypothetical protein
VTPSATESPAVLCRWHLNGWDRTPPESCPLCVRRRANVDVIRNAADRASDEESGFEPTPAPARPKEAGGTAARPSPTPTSVLVFTKGPTGYHAVGHSARVASEFLQLPLNPGGCLWGGGQTDLLALPADRAVAAFDTLRREGYVVEVED